MASAPTMTKPLTIIWLPSPLAPLTNWAMPTLPPAPGTLVTCTLRATPEATSACCIERAVWSQPPPGAAGAISLSSSCWAGAGVAAARVSATAAPARRAENWNMRTLSRLMRTFAALCRLVAYQPKRPRLSSDRAQIPELAGPRHHPAQRDGQLAGHFAHDLADFRQPIVG